MIVCTETCEKADHREQKASASDELAVMLQAQEAGQLRGRVARIRSLRDMTWSFTAYMEAYLNGDENRLKPLEDCCSLMQAHWGADVIHSLATNRLQG